MSTTKGIKIILTMIGLDGHTTGAETVGMILRDAGMEVVYLGCNRTPEMIVEAALQEDVDVIGISSHASNYDQIAQVVQLLRARNMGDIPVVCGGNIPRARIKALQAQGIAAVFPPGSSSESIVGSIAALVRGHEAALPLNAARGS